MLDFLPKIGGFRHISDLRIWQKALYIEEIEKE